MLIKLLSPSLIEKRRYAAGLEVECDTMRAKGLIKKGHAVEVKNRPRTVAPVEAVEPEKREARVAPKTRKAALDV